MDFKLFNRWDVSTLKVNDVALQSYINIKPILVPRTAGRAAKNRLWNDKAPIVERLMNKILIPGHKGKKHKISSGRSSGKAVMAYQIVIKTFQIIEQTTKKNPIEVFVKALENAAPREEITTIEYGGARYPQAVDIAPQRRIDLALRLMTQGAYQKSFNNKVRYEKVLADEIIAASLVDQKSAAIAKKLELERQADASR